MVEELRSGNRRYSAILNRDRLIDESRRCRFRSLSILTNPPQSKVFVDNVAVGQSQADGWLLLEGLQSGNHRLRVSTKAFRIGKAKLSSTAKPQQVVAEADEGAAKFRRTQETDAATRHFNTCSQISRRKCSRRSGRTVHNSQAADAAVRTRRRIGKPAAAKRYVAVESQPRKKSAFSPLLLAIIGISGLLLLTVLELSERTGSGFIGANERRANVTSNDIVRRRTIRTIRFRRSK